MHLEIMLFKYFANPLVAVHTNIPNAKHAGEDPVLIVNAIRNYITGIHHILQCRLINLSLSMSTASSSELPQLFSNFHSKSHLNFPFSECISHRFLSTSFSLWKITPSQITPNITKHRPSLLYMPRKNNFPCWAFPACGWECAKNMDKSGTGWSSYFEQYFV